MKKSLIALAVMAASGAAMAQSSVTLFGIVDAAYGRVSGNGTSVTGISNSGINSSRLGFRGEEDLGGGMKAGFWLEGQLYNDVGQGANATTPFNFQRRATVSVMGGFGEVRIGRDYTPSFWNTTVFDPFGTNGVGQSMTPGMGPAGATNTNAVRANNSVGYFLPGNLGGIYGQAMMAMGENTASVKTNNYTGFRVGYAAGPLNVAYAYGKTEGATDAADTKYSNLGASYDLGVANLMVTWAEEKTGAGAKTTGQLIGATMPMGAGQIRAAYSRYNVAASSDDWNKLAIGYVHNLSKRTALYATYARVSNDGAQTKVVANNGLGNGQVSTITAAPGGNSTGYEFGVRHSF